MNLEMGSLKIGFLSNLDCWFFEFLINSGFSNQIEKKRRPLPDYLEKVQKDVNKHERGFSGLASRSYR